MEVWWWFPRRWIVASFYWELFIRLAGLVLEDQNFSGVILNPWFIVWFVLWRFLGKRGLVWVIWPHREKGYRVLLNGVRMFFFRFPCTSSLSSFPDFALPCFFGFLPLQRRICPFCISICQSSVGFAELVDWWLILFFFPFPPPSGVERDTRGSAVTSFCPRRTPSYPTQVSWKDGGEKIITLNMFRDRCMFILTL